MGIEVASSFTRKAAVPIDDLSVVADITARDAIASGVRFRGMVVHVLSDSKNYQLSGGITNSDWKPYGSGGGGGAGANWVSGQTDGPLEDIEFNEKVFLFDTSLTQKVYLNLKISANYSTGTRIRLIVKVYAPSLSATNKAKLKLTSTLFKDGVTALGSTANQNISQQEITIAGSNIPQTITFDVTDAAGKINSVDLALNDSVQVELTRVAASASEEPTDLRFRPSTTEVLL